MPVESRYIYKVKEIKIPGTEKFTLKVTWDARKVRVKWAKLKLTAQPNGPACSVSVYYEGERVIRIGWTAFETHQKSKSGEISLVNGSSEIVVKTGKNPFAVTTTKMVITLILEYEWEAIAPGAEPPTPVGGEIPPVSMKEIALIGGLAAAGIIGGVAIAKLRK